MKMLNDYIMVEKIEEDKGDGFQLATAVDSIITRGKVIESNALPLVAGTEIIFSKYAGEEHEYKGRKVKFIKIEDVIGYE
jgi:co-chaperonin GroES (HSP10)